jgi:hypothetical protein
MENTNKPNPASENAKPEDKNKSGAPANAPIVDPKKEAQK